jgi:RHS repeat-associated protein
MTFHDGEVVTYNYDVGGRLFSVIGNKAGTQTVYASKITYDDQGSRKRIYYGNNVNTVYNYDPVMRRLTNVDTRVGTTGTFLQKLEFTFDAVSNVKTFKNNVDAPTVNPPTGTLVPWKTNQTFIYDNLDQLKTASGTLNGPPSAGTKSYTLSMTYDEINNIKTKNQTTSPTGSSNYNWTYAYSTTRPHIPTTIGPTTGAQTLAYDADGNQTSSTGGPSTDTRTSVWDEEDRLKRVTYNSVQYNYLYGADGERSHKQTSPGQTYYINPNYVVRVGSQTTKHITIGAERIASVVTPDGSSTGSRFFYHSDHLQSSGYVTDSQARITQHNEYFPHGEVFVDELRSGSTKTPYLFNAKELDETKLYYFGARYYDPRSSLWASSDPILANYMQRGPSGASPKNLGLYAYGWNNPVVMRDPDGREVWPEHTERGRRAMEESASKDAERAFNRWKAGIDYTRAMHPPEPGPGPLGVPLLRNPIAEMYAMEPEQGLDHEDPILAALLLRGPGMGGGAGVVATKGPAATLELARKIAAAGEGPAWARTVAVMETREGVTLVGAGARDLTAAQKTLAESMGLKVVPDLPGIHAEGTLLNGAGMFNLTPRFGVVTNNVCSRVCTPMIEEMGGWSWGRYFGFPVRAQ